MEVKADMVMKLRDRTGMQMMKCKAALIEAGGDMEKAVELLRKQNKDAGAKLQDRATGEGRIGVHIDPAKNVGAMVELLCESSPVAKNEMFVTLANDLARQVALKGAPASVEAFLASPFIDDPAKTVKDRIGDVVGLMRENIRPSRIQRYEGLVGQYVHHDGTVGALVHVEGTSADAQLLREVCMHITARNPMAAHTADIPADKLAKEKEIAIAQAQEQGKNKPANIIEKIAEGKINTWLQENVLAEQKFVKDETKSISQLLAGSGLNLKSFARFRVGDGAA